MPFTKIALDDDERAQKKLLSLTVDVRNSFRTHNSQVSYIECQKRSMKVR